MEVVKLILELDDIEDIDKFRERVEQLITTVVDEENG
jgi:hypothetical protein